MATVPQDALSPSDNVKPLGEQIRALVQPLASLKITVTVFALSLFLILIGSLAQARSDVWAVVGQYFRCWIAWVDVRDFFPPAFFPSLLDFDWNGLPVRRFPFPGGWMLGAVAAVNLFAAHGLRFKVQAKGTRLTSGLAALFAGILVTWIVVASGMNADGFQAEPLVEYETLWRVFQVTMGAGLIWAGWQAWSLISTPGSPLMDLGLRLSLVLGTAALVIALAIMDPLSGPSMRILWQLMKAQFASFILLYACWMLFKKRAGVVLLHSGVAMLMFSEVLVGLTVSENRFQMWEGETSNYVFDLRERELVVVDNSGDEAKVISIPEKLIFDAEDDSNQAVKIQDQRLPFDLEIVKFYLNSTLRNAKENEKNLATAGRGLSVVAESAKQAGGMDSKSDESAAYVRVLDKNSGDSLGTYMLAMRLEDQSEPVVVDGRIYDISLRFKRTYKPYSITLLNVEKNDYIGTSTPRDYASTILLEDPENDVEREVRIWMNNPLRYRGETFYQTDYLKSEETGEELSSLQVVNNRGWMLPYMACMIVLTGMAMQFGMALKRFQSKQSRGAFSAAPDSEADFVTPTFTTPGKSNPASGRFASRRVLRIAMALVVGLLVVGYFGSRFRPPSVKKGEANLYAFGKIPVVKGGRQQPLSSVAMNRMRVLTNGKTTFHRELRESEMTEQWEDVSGVIAAAIPGIEVADLKEFEGGVPELVKYIAAGTEMKEEEVYQRLSKRGWTGKSAITRRAPAMWWMLDAIAQRDEARRHRVIRIDQPQLISMLKLEQPREGAMYSLAEVMEHLDSERVQAALAKASRQFREDADRAEPLQRRLLALATKVGRMTQTRDVFSSFEFDAEELHSSLMKLLEIEGLVVEMGQLSDSALALQIPRPTDTPGKEWSAMPVAAMRAELIQHIRSTGTSDIDGFVDTVVEELPTKLVDQYLAQLIGVIQPLIDEDDSLSTLARTFRTRLEQEARRQQVRPPALELHALSMIENSDKTTAEDVLENATAEDKDRLFVLGASSLLSNATELASDETRKQIDQVYGSEDVSRETVTPLVRSITKDLLVQVVTDREVAAGPSAETLRLAAILEAWKNEDTSTFNSLVGEHNEAVARIESDRAKAEKEDEDSIAAAMPPIAIGQTRFEAWFNNSAPAYYCAAMYLIAFAISCLALVLWPDTLGRIAFSMTLVTFVFHTFALVGRVYISGRPPVTNLYSSAVFIGWGAVLLGLIFEFVNKRGIGNLVSTAAGAATLVIAYFLSKDGDTFEVLQAVLDTQFWLATHVVCITLGYSATFLAGLFGMVYIAKGFFTNTLRDADRKELSRMIYGTICFAMLFSFVGTILGGLWADDSWGRFWGWDPKENGAMMIVIWNAIVMHARWDNMIKDRGMAVLSAVGNIVTAWSWFGVNELRAGLHSYGFTEGRLFWLNVWVVLNLLFILIGLLPKSWWGSFRKDGEMNLA